MAERFGKYELLAKLAKGGMAQTYRARLLADAGVTKELVIKKVLPHFAEDEAFVTAFINEARISASLSHGNIAQVFDFGRVEGDYFIAMEWIEGRSLAQVLERAAELGFARLPVPIACFITIEVLKGLHYAHTRTGSDGQALQIVHRDISPDNILLGFEGQTKVVDFGVAKAVLQGRVETEPGLVKGKYLYFSPEQAEALALDARSDVFAVGVVLYAMLCGELPFNGQMHTVMHAIVRGDFRPVAVVNPRLPSTLAAIVGRAMATDRTKRFPNALAFQEELSTFLYRQEASFSGESVKEWMGWLFADELGATGKQVQLSARFEAQLQKWSEPRLRESPTGVRPAPTRPDLATPSLPASAAATRELPRTPKRWPWIVLAAVTVLGVSAGLLVNSPRPPGPRPTPKLARAESPLEQWKAEMLADLDHLMSAIPEANLDHRVALSAFRVNIETVTAPEQQPPLEEMLIRSHGAVEFLVWNERLHACEASCRKTAEGCMPLCSPSVTANPGEAQTCLNRCVEEQRPCLSACNPPIRGEQLVPLPPGVPAEAPDDAACARALTKGTEASDELLFACAASRRLQACHITGRFGTGGCRSYVRSDDLCGIQKVCRAPLRGTGCISSDWYGRSNPLFGCEGGELAVGACMLRKLLAGGYCTPAVQNPEVAHAEWRQRVIHELNEMELHSAGRPEALRLEHDDLIAQLSSVANQAGEPAFDERLAALRTKMANLIAPAEAAPGKPPVARPGVVSKAPTALARTHNAGEVPEVCLTPDWSQQLQRAISVAEQTFAAHHSDLEPLTELDRLKAVLRRSSGEEACAQVAGDLLAWKKRHLR